VIKDFGTGLGFLAKGFRIVLGTPRLLARGALPALISLLLLIGGLVALVVWIDDITAWVTPFADDWSQWWRGLIRIAAGISVVGAAIAVGMLLFTGLTIAIGAPFYESIAEEVEDQLGGVPEAEQAGWARSAAAGIGDSLRLVLFSLLVAIPLFFAGFIPVLGQTVVPILAICVSAWLLGMELTGIPFSRRGMDLKARRRVLRKRRSMVLGLALPAYLLFLVPFAVLIVMPAAMAGGTLLAHRALQDNKHRALQDNKA
jgi:CysZ protein